MGCNGPRAPATEALYEKTNRTDHQKMNEAQLRIAITQKLDQILRANAPRGTAERNTYQLGEAIGMQAGETLIELKADRPMLLALGIAQGLLANVFEVQAEQN